MKVKLPKLLTGQGQESGDQMAYGMQLCSPTGLGYLSVNGWAKLLVSRSCPCIATETCHLEDTLSHI